jgi:hypothetical protein
VAKRNTPGANQMVEYGVPKKLKEKPMSIGMASAVRPVRLELNSCDCVPFGQTGLRSNDDDDDENDDATLCGASANMSTVPTTDWTS